MTKLGIWFDEKGAKKTLSIDDYNSLVAKKEKEKLADFIYNRFHSRYIKPFIFDEKEFKVKHLNGFSIMANCCLTIEAFESFRRGWLNTNGKSRLAFKYFFSTESNFSVSSTGRVIAKDSLSIGSLFNVDAVNGKITSGDIVSGKIDVTGTITTTSHININSS
jgi:hypothetical protein